MIIGYDGQKAVNDISRQGIYSRRIIEGIAGDYTGDTLFLYTSQISTFPFPEKIQSAPNIEIRYPAPQGLKGRAWRAFGITNHLRADKVDIFHGLNNELPLNIKSGGVPAVVTIHDLTYRHLPKYYSPLYRWNRDFRYSRSCQDANHIIALSQQIKEDIVETFGIDPEKVTVIYPGCDPMFRHLWNDEELSGIRKRLNLPDRYILQKGPIEKRNNLEITVRALSNISPDMSLVVIGQENKSYRRFIERIAAETGVSNRIVWINQLPFQEMPGVIQCAEIVVDPSLHVGFPTTVLEGLESNRPVIAAAGSGSEEVGGPDTIYIDPTDPADMVQAIHSILSDPAAARMMAAAGREYAIKFRSEQTMAKIRNIYEFTIENFKSKIFPH